MEHYVKVGRVKDFREHRGRTVDLDGVKVAVFRVDGRYVALQDACPHMGASLADGKVAGNHVVCHWHGWKFDLETGQGDMRSWACARTYEVKVDGDAVLLKRPDVVQQPQSAPADDEPDWFAWDPDRFLKSDAPEGERS